MLTLMMSYIFHEHRTLICGMCQYMHYWEFRMCFSNVT